MPYDDLTRRSFLKKAGAASVAATLGAGGGMTAPLSAAEKTSIPLLPNAADLPSGGKPIKLFCCDLNFAAHKEKEFSVSPALPQDWAYLDAKEYFAWHRDFGVNIFFLQGYSWCGYAFYPTMLGPVAPGPGAELFPKMFKLAEKAGLPFSGDFGVNGDLIMSNLHNDWTVPTSRNRMPEGLLAPESPWTDLLCARITEFLRLYPVEWINFDCFNYGRYNSNEFQVQPSRYVKGPFKEIIGREMPERAADITPEENLKYKREIMARQYYRIREAMHAGNPGTKANFNVPFFKAEEPMWVDHPMVNECDQLIAESSDEVVSWLLKIRKPHQRVMTTIIWRQDRKGTCDPNTWKKWYEAGCDFFGYAHGIAPDFRPHPALHDQVEVVREAFHKMP